MDSREEFLTKFRKSLLGEYIALGNRRAFEMNPDGKEFENDKVEHAYAGYVLAKEEIDQLQARLNELESQVPKWITLEEFKQEANEGWRWIIYKGRTVEAYHDHEGRFLFSKFSRNCFMSECISMVMPWPYPLIPEAE